MGQNRRWGDQGLHTQHRATLQASFRELVCRESVLSDFCGKCGEATGKKAGPQDCYYRSCQSTMLKESWKPGTVECSQDHRVVLQTVIKLLGKSSWGRLCGDTKQELQPKPASTFQKD